MRSVDVNRWKDRKLHQEKVIDVSLTRKIYFLKIYDYYSVTVVVSNQHLYKCKVPLIYMLPCNSTRKIVPNWFRQYYHKISKLFLNEQLRNAKLLKKIIHPPKNVGKSSLNLFQLKKSCAQFYDSSINSFKML